MSKKLTLEEMQQIAVERGGKCLSDSYVNGKTKLLWECAEGHQWETKPNDVKNQGSWCPKCSAKRRGEASRLSIEEMQQIAEKRGGKCLSETYTDANIKLWWECAEGHKWPATPHSVKRGSWCRKCAGLEKGTIEAMQQIAAERGGKCLSEIYVNSTTKLWWECTEGHTWEATPDSIKRGQWCKKCSAKRRGEASRLGIEEMQQIAQKRGGKCLSEAYINTDTKLLWECAEGDQWEAAPHGIKAGDWCPYCAGNAKGTIEEMQRIAKERGGKCLSETYISNKKKLLWECAKGHMWEATPHSIKDSAHWCQKCAGTAKGTIEEMQQIAAERDGKCLSETYTNSSTKLRWQCAEGHPWEATPGVIKSGQWCPECSSGLGERICRAFFEQLFEKKFPKRHPKWLINPETNGHLELDGYCQSLKLAFEHQGRQHNEIDGYRVRTEADLREIQERDRIKKNYVCNTALC